MLFTSLPITAQLVRSRRRASCVNRQKRNCSSSRCVTHSRATSEWICRSQTSASHTLVSRKFNEFIKLFVGQTHLRAFGTDQRKNNAPPFRPLGFQQHLVDAADHQLAHRAALLSRLLLQFPVDRGGDVYGRSDRFWWHVLAPLLLSSINIYPRHRQA